MTVGRGGERDSLPAVTVEPGRRATLVRAGRLYRALRALRDDARWPPCR